MELRNMKFAVVDTETTGGGVHGGDRVMEVAVVHVDGADIRPAVDLLIDPQRPVGSFVSRLTGITWQMVREAPTFGDVAEIIHDALAGRVFVAQNVRFDWRFLSMELRRATGRGLAGDRLCTVRLARKLLTHLPRRSLDALAWHYDVPITRRHRAGGDALATAQVLVRMLSDARRQDVDTWDDLQRLLRRPRVPAPRSALPQPVAVEAIA
jgi:DNA polymerase III subunit epsilon